MTIDYLHLTNLGPFDDIEFHFDKNVNVLLGPNNCGKSTALMALADILVYPFNIPRKLLREGTAKYKIRANLISNKRKRIYSGELPIFWTGPSPKIEKREAERLADIGFSIFVPAIRRSTDYRSKGPTPGESVSRKDKLSERSQEPELQKRAKLSEVGPSLVTDEAIIQTIIDLDYRSYREKNPFVRQLIVQIAQISSEITEGFPLEFIGVGEDDNGLYPEFRTPDGDLPLNFLSQGTQSIVQWVSHLVISYADYYGYIKNFASRPAILIIDELDSHLHPSWQRRILPTLAKHFPKLQVFCSTHSPLMVAGLRAGQIQLLQRNKKGKVTVSTNETDIVSWSGDEILRNIFELTNVTDLATDEKLQRLMTLRRKKKLSNGETRELNRLRRTINENLMSAPISQDVEQLVDRLKKTIDRPSAKKTKSKTTPRTKRRRGVGSKSVS